MAKRAQAAIEYMMTYGWAVLIIVVVMVFLYSMGVFSPSRSVTPTSTGFSPFSISAAICNSTELTFSMQVLFSGNVEYGYLKQITFTSALGSNITSGTFNLNNMQVIRGHFYNINIKDISCPAPAVTFRFASVLEYSDVSSSLKATYNTTGTIAGKST